MSFLLDTNILSEHLRRPSGLVHRFVQHSGRLYTSSVYMACLPGGWIADRWLGARRAVLYGGILIAAGHFSMAIPALATFYLGLTLIVLGIIAANAAHGGLELAFGAPRPKDREVRSIRPAG